MSTERERQELLETSIEELRAEVSAQRSAIRDLTRRLEARDAETPGDSRQPASDGGRTGLVSRSTLLKSATAATAGAVAAGLMIPAIAAAETEPTPEVCPNLRVTGPKPASGIGVDASTPGAGFSVGVSGASKTGTGVHGQTAGATGAGVSGRNTASGDGVFGTSANFGVHGHSSGDGGAGVFGSCDQGGTCVYGYTAGMGTALVGRSKGYALQAESTGGYHAIQGSTSGDNGGAGVWGASRKQAGVLGTTDESIGVHGKSTNHVGIRGDGFHGVWGFGTDEGVYGHSESGSGGVFESVSGSSLTLGSGAKSLPSGSGGDLTVLGNGLAASLWFCTSPGNWTQLA